MWLDSPRLTWRPHIANVKSACIPRLNIIKSISSFHWGADRRLLLNVYVAYVRSLIDYGSVFYSVAPHYILSSLDRIQNLCLRLALGVRQTTPIISLEIESNVPPLDIHRTFTMLKYYNRLSQLPSHLDISTELFVNCAPLFQKKWSRSSLPPLIVRCRTAYRKLNVTKPPYRSSPLVHPLPPWVNAADIFNPDFPLPFAKLASPQQVYGAFLTLRHDCYSTYTEIYTDGSYQPGPPPSSTAAIAVLRGTTFETHSWKLHSSCSIFVAELFAILRALTYVSHHCTDSLGVVIYTDSLSSILALQNYLYNAYVPLVYAIHECLSNLLSLFPVKVQYVPSHRNIPGNVVADEVAVKAHSDRVLSLLSPVTIEDLARILKVTLWEKWTARYHDNIMNSGKALHFFSCKQTAQYWPWANHKIRSVETAMARLRTGHVGLNAHMFRISQTVSNLCTCGCPETVDHFLLTCPLYSVERAILKRELLLLDVPFTRTTLLGGGTYKEPKQLRILDLVATFLTSTGKLTNL